MELYLHSLILGDKHGNNFTVPMYYVFLAVNHFPALPKDPTDKYQKLIHKTLQQYNKIVDKHKINYCIQKKPSPQH